jgi:hypothetical protein
MALPSSPQPISFSEIRTEFGASGSNQTAQIGNYRINQNIGSLTNLRLDTGVPGPGQSISFSDFYNKRLNVVVNLYSGGATTRENARSRYDNLQTVVVGGFKSPSQVPSAGSGSKIIANVNRRIGSEKGNRNNVALKTGNWNSTALFELIIGSSGELYGAGGDGGIGGGTSSVFNVQSNGGQGTSALGVEYPTRIVNQGTIFGGRGGGGGGAGGYGWTFSDTQDGCEGRRNESLRVGGGGGAGGRGFPGGTGGDRNQQFTLRGASVNLAANGTNGTASQNGLPGRGGNTFEGNRCNRHAFSGGGGVIESGGSTGDVSYNNQGSGGQRGYAIVISPSGNILSYSGNSADGNTVNGVVT